MLLIMRQLKEGREISNSNLFFSILWERYRQPKLALIEGEQNKRNKEEEEIKDEKEEQMKEKKGKRRVRKRVEERKRMREGA